MSMHPTTQAIRTCALALSCLLALAPVAAAGEPAASEQIRFETAGPIPLLHPSYGTGPIVRVLMTDDRITPARVRVKPGQTVEWRSVARHASQIVFEREVARSMVCHSLVNFEIRGDQLRSAPLHTGDRSSFCRLSPGRYRYRIERDGPAQYPSTGAVNLSTRLEGELVVEAGAGPIAQR